jgi:hypothetical protein
MPSRFLNSYDFTGYDKAGRIIVKGRVAADDREHATRIVHARYGELLGERRPHIRRAGEHDGLILVEVSA